MTTFRFEPSELLAAFLDSRQNWYCGEMHTLTGYDQAEYQALKVHGERISEDVATLMLRQAANTLLGYPSISVEACAEHLGLEWRARLSVFLGLDSN